jgi:hypothetical protein
MDETLRYDVMVESALRRVVADTLKIVAERGLPGSHHFYISFLTEYPGVQIPSYLHEQYPKEMTIVLQYQYYGLVVNETSFSATLSFNNVKERLVIPLAAITTFADPSVNFALQFQTIGDDEDEEDADETAATTPTKDDKAPAAEGEKGVVISLDQFRKKGEKDV